MEVLHHVGLAVVVAVSAVVHANPQYTVHLVEYTTLTVVLGNEYQLFEVLLVAGIYPQAVGTVAVVGKPDKAVAIEEHAQDAYPRGLPQLTRFLTVGVKVDGSALAARIDVVAVGEKGGHLLILEESLPLDAHVADIDAMHTLVGSHPNVIVVTLGYAVNGKLGGGDELHVGLALVELHAVHAHTGKGA